MASNLRDIRLDIANRLRTARESAGLSQGQVAKKLGLHRPAVSEIEAGRRRVTADELVRLADIYGVSTGWITSGNEGGAEDMDDRVLLAARQLSRIKAEDLAKLMKLIRMLRRSKSG